MADSDVKAEGSEPIIPRASKMNSRTRVINENVLLAAERGRTGKKLPVMEMAQLRAPERLHGREEQLNLLKGKLRKLKHAGGNPSDDGTRTRPELLLFAGVSGVGKSALVTRGLRDPAQKMGLAFAGGKFDFQHTALPLSAFTQAMSSLTKFVAASKDRLKKIRDGINVEFGEEDRILLAQVLAGCEELFPFEEAPGNDCAPGRMSLVEGKEAVVRKHYAIRRLLNIICSNLKGAVLFIDDLQWSDAGTLDLLRSIALDTDIPSLLLVGAYRQDEVSESHPLSIHIQELGEQRGVSISTINVEHLSLGSATSLVAEVLNMEEKEVAALAATVHKKTAGNAFFVIMFLRNLYDEGLIHYNLGPMKWMWDDDAVSSAMVTQNLATVLINKLKKFRDTSQRILMVASCLGASFSTSIMTMVVETLTLESKKGSVADSNETASQISCAVDEFEQEGLWEEESCGRCHFTHDQIQYASFELIPANEKDSFRGRVGSAMMKRLEPDLLEGCLFEAVSLQNCAMCTMCEDQRSKHAEMNLQAGLKASKIGSFESAIVYFKAGRELLGHSWESNPNTMLQLSSEEANARFIASNDLETMNELIHDVLNQPVPVKDHFKAVTVKVEALIAAGNYIEAINTGLDFCRRLGLRLPKNKPASIPSILKGYFKTRRALRKFTPEEIACLPEVSDESIIMGRAMLETLGSAFNLAQPTLLSIVIFLIVQSSLKHGISANSSSSFAGYGLVLCALGKPKEGREMVRAAELILAHLGTKETQSKVINLAECAVLHWTAPLQASLTPLLKGYQVGFETGDIEYTSNCLICRCMHLFYSARPLDSVQREIDACMDIISQFNLKAHTLWMLPLRLGVTKLRGVDVAEESIDLETMLKAAIEERNLVVCGLIHTVWMELAVIFQEWERATELIIEAGAVRKHVPVFFFGIRFTVLEALISFKAAQTSAWAGRIKWKRRGLKAMKLLRGWAKRGNVNVVHVLHLLSAELAALEGKLEKAKGDFKAAVSVAAGNGFVQDKALAHMLAGAYYASQGDEHWADYHHGRSQEAYADWGAKSKIEGL